MSLTADTHTQELSDLSRKKIPHTAAHTRRPLAKHRFSGRKSSPNDGHELIFSFLRREREKEKHGQSWFSLESKEIYIISG